LTIVGPGSAIVINRTAETGSTRCGGAGAELAVLEAWDQWSGENGGEEGGQPKDESMSRDHDGDDDWCMSEEPGFLLSCSAR